MRRKVWVGTLIALGAALLVFHQPIATSIQSAFATKDSRSVVGLVEDLFGDVQIKNSSSLEHQPLSKNQKVRHQDTIIVGRDARLILRMNSGLVLEIEPLSMLFFEELDHILITFQRGSYKVLEKGGRVPEIFILKDGVLQDPLGRKLTAMNIGKSGKARAEPDEESSDITPSSGELDTLSDVYISGVMQGQKGFLNRCYAQHLRSNPQSKGDMQITFTIQPGGQVTDLKLLKSTIKDEELQKCTLSVIERAQFKSFKGEPIIINYPIYFE